MPAIRRVARSVKLLAHALVWVSLFTALGGVFVFLRGGMRSTALGPATLVLEIYMVVGALLLAAIFRHVARLATLYEAGRLFTADNVRHMRWIGWLAVATTVTPRLAIEDTPPFGVDWAFSPAVAVLGLLLVFMSWVIDEARKLKDDSELVI